MINSFKALEERLSTTKPIKLCVAGAADKDVLLAVKNAASLGYVSPVLVGNKDEVEALVAEIKLENYILFEPQDGRNEAEEAVHLIHEQKADLLMKGTVDTTAYMRAILNKEKGLRTGGLVSALGVYEVPNYHKLIFGSDSGISVAPDLEQKQDILRNSLQVLKAFGYTNPKIAFLAASEIVNKNVQATVDAAALVDLAKAGEFGKCIAEGPLALDVIFDKEAAKHKHIESEISGDVDLLIFPNMETGNVLAKSWLHFCKAKWGGLVLGCKKPVILGSRSDTAEVKINSIILGCLMAQEQ